MDTLHSRSSIDQQRQLLRWPLYQTSGNEKFERESCKLARKQTDVVDVLQVLAVGPRATSIISRVCATNTSIFKMQTALDSYDGLRSAAVSQPDVVLLQIESPWMDGCELARHLRSDYPTSNCLIVGFIKHENSLQRRKSIEAGINLLFTDSVDVAILELILVLEYSKVFKNAGR